LQHNILNYFYGNEVIDYEQTRNLNSISFSHNDLREIITICPWQIEKVDAKFDLFWNSASFQEMTKDMVINYTKHIDRLFRNNKSKFCLYVYKGGNEKTIIPKELVKIIENNSFILIEELSPELDINNAHYFI